MELAKNTKNPLFSNIFYITTLVQFRHISRLLGFTIALNIFGFGLHILHRGTIIVTPKAKVGKRCKLNADVQIGPGRNGAPLLGDNCYIGPGAKIMGGIELGNNIRIGANAVVNKSFPEGHVLLTGIPATARTLKKSVK